MSTVLKWIVRIFGVLIGLLLLIFVVAAAMPAQGRPGCWGRSWRGSQQRAALLHRPAARIPAAQRNGRKSHHRRQSRIGQPSLLRSGLSANNDIACATCHQPDLGFADGRPLAIGPDGTVLSRKHPGLWNVGYAQNLVLGRPSRYPRSPIRNSPHPPRRNGRQRYGRSGS